MRSDNAPATAAPEPAAIAEDSEVRDAHSGEPVIEELVEEISIDGMCGVY